jgi:hypothetical protein
VSPPCPHLTHPLLSPPPCWLLVVWKARGAAAAKADAAAWNQMHRKVATSKPMSWPAAVVHAVTTRASITHHCICAGPPGAALTLCLEDRWAPLLGMPSMCSSCCCRLASAHPTVQKAWDCWAGRGHDSCNQEGAQSNTCALCKRLCRLTVKHRQTHQQHACMHHCTQMTSCQGMWLKPELPCCSRAPANSLSNCSTANLAGQSWGTDSEH